MGGLATGLRGLVTDLKENADNILANDDPERADAERSTWHIGDQSRNYKMKRWVRNQRLRNKVTQLRKVGELKGLADLDKIDIAENFAADLEDNGELSYSKVDSDLAEVDPANHVDLLGPETLK